MHACLDGSILSTAIGRGKLLNSLADQMYVARLGKSMPVCVCVCVCLPAAACTYIYRSHMQPRIPSPHAAMYVSVICLDGTCSLCCRGQLCHMQSATYSKGKDLIEDGYLHR